MAQGHGQIDKIVINEQQKDLIMLIVKQHHCKTSNIGYKFVVVTDYGNNEYQSEYRISYFILTVFAW